ncbi:MAG TPA: GntR family transcriptional regulator [Burkholderiales bacterium]|nr:GntR family transcriptional regulator [Burkholderiales bacterium]
MRRSLALATRAPLYKEVEREIMQRLAAGEWKPGEQLPTEPELAELFGVAVFTIRAGIQKLVESGVLLRRQGKGTFVALHSARPFRNQFLRVFSNDGEQANWDREFISLEKKRASDDVAAILRLGDSAAERAIYEMLFLLKNDGKTMAFVESSMAARFFRNMTSAALRGTADNFYAVFQERFGVNVIRIEERVRAVKAGRAGAKWLRVEPREPMLRIERVAYTYNDQPVELRHYNVQAESYCYFAPSGT